MGAIRTARERARAELTQEIKNAARRQLGEVGAQQLSLRAVARELGMASSALYRYFPNRDELLTALIIDAYEALGDAAEAADATPPPGDLRARWCTIHHAVRDWARAHPHEYALIYGSPVPGYAAPQTTIAPAGRVPLLLLRLAHRAHTEGALHPAFDGPPLPPTLAGQAAAVADLMDVPLPEPDLTRVMVAWIQLFGTISFELFGQLTGGADPADAFFHHTTDQMADLVGLPH
ncbi:TetR/AcrR family transcriptional regulator [Actinomadura craniellae]|uniref:TetR/AcrR family transcriptional regulator n=1 Tax=Actinomadura craniellae TaxID=2231787 RepID=A0A365H2T1_9ACTN|nr:TetR/AcrR family transcriptional regulator [Actinomadura craniellae]RAY13338.1 TetR/AcrR family transcriptional regulator [Actinomadura craniellae]